jgi:anti-sigma regulatory factor (Ser/Thr protein kinase)
MGRGHMSRRVEARLPRERGCAGIARRFVEEHFTGEVEGEALDDLRLVATELVENAYLHGRGEIRLRLEAVGDRVRIEVIDEGEGEAIKIRREAEDGLGGYGLRVVDRLSESWGAHEGTTHVWAELRTA